MSEIVLREMVAGDVPAALRLSRASGWNQTEADWRFFLEQNPGRFVAAVRDGRVVGTGGASCYAHRLAWVCMILVDESERGHGIGSDLVRSVLERVVDVETVGLDATPRGRPVYERLGFTAASDLVRVGGSADTVAQAAADGTARAEPVTARDLEAILRFDLDAFGADRSAALRWAHAQHPELCRRVIQRGELAGYCLGRVGERAVHVGPVVARTVDVARAVVASAAGAVPGRDLMLDVPTHPPGWLDALRALGFLVQRPFTRMYCAGAPPGGRPELTRAAFGPELG